MCIDNTHWKLGKSFVNILMLGIKLKGVALPVVCVLLPVQGNSNTKQRMELINRFIELFSKDRIAYLTALTFIKVLQHPHFLVTPTHVTKSVITKMARIAKPLTNTEVKQAKPKAKEYNLADGDGLALRVKPNGSKLWLFNYYRPHTRKRANVGFGSFPELSLG